MKEKARLTVDMSPDEHMVLKMASAKVGVTMRDFVIRAVFRWIEEMEDQWLAERARETLADIESGKEKTVSWTEAKKRIS